MRRRPEALLVVVLALAFSEGCGSCVGEPSPSESTPAPQHQNGKIDPRFLKTRADPETEAGLVAPPDPQ